MGSEARRARIAAGLPVESAAAYRRRTRKEATIVREDYVLELYAQGATSQAIMQSVADRFGGSINGKNLKEMIRRALYRRVEQNSPNVEIAREMLLEQYRKVLEVYMPRALGLGDRDADGNLPTPDVRAAELALKVLDKVGIATGAIAPPKAGDVNLNILQVPADADRTRAQILETLAAEKHKQLQIDGALVDTPATEAAEILDGKIMPPIPVAPQEKREPDGR